MGKQERSGRKANHDAISRRDRCVRLLVSADAFTLGTLGTHRSTPMQITMLEEKPQRGSPMPWKLARSNTMVESTKTGMTKDDETPASEMHPNAFYSEEQVDDPRFSCWLAPDGSRWICATDLALWDKTESHEDSY